ncbi:unnamed protein product [Tilletia controversa]|uniref:Uncharacterized protein n=1 Tax=Tilletia controversa TaxID=13291 RepID=A0A8X7MTW8_9BASI|nr:hypothetical protein A4X06_0g3762 [Tilletia controversa]CAD6904843.1 unnamed protein product [Tilletia controversa]CAD6917036.1 unnamed protein product [Tilletia controversa]
MRILGDIVKRCDLGEVLSSNPFLLFYERWDGMVGGQEGGGSGASRPDSNTDGSSRGGGGGSTEAEPARITALDDIDKDGGDGAGLARCGRSAHRQ